MIAFCICSNLILSLGIIGLNLYLAYHLVYKQTVSAEIQAAGRHFSSAIRSVEFARIPVVGMAVIAEMGGIPLAEVIRAYEKDSMERRAIVYSIMVSLRKVILKKR